MNRQRILLAVAMTEEALPLREHFGMRTISPSPLDPLPAQVASAESSRAEIILVTNGVVTWHDESGAREVDLIGTVPSALTLQRAILAFSPSIVVNIGVCGGYARHGAAIGNVYLANHAYFHDRRVPDEPGLNGWHHFLRRDFLAFDPTPLAEALGLPLPAVTTGDAFDLSAIDEARIGANGATLKEMEAAAFAWTAAIYRTPIVLLKAVTDIVDQVEHPNERQFVENLRLATARLSHHAIKLIDYIAAHPIDAMGHPRAAALSSP